MDGSSDAGPELASREGPAAMESTQALITPLERVGGEGIKKERSERQGLGQSPNEKTRPGR